MLKIFKYTKSYQFSKIWNIHFCILILYIMKQICIKSDLEYVAS